jgi:hypothetical protein
MKWYDKVVVAILLGVHALLVAIGVGGLVELVATPPWEPFSNPDLPRWMLTLQWLLMLGAGLLFIAGFLARWRLLPWVMAFVYGVMAAVCAIQTFTMLTNENRYLLMAIEYVEYTVILLYLFNAPAMRRRFSRKQARA